LVPESSLRTVGGFLHRIVLCPNLSKESGNQEAKKQRGIIVSFSRVPKFHILSKLPWLRRSRSAREWKHEEIRETSVIDSGGGDLHERVCGRAHASKLQEERQELPDERQQGLQLREEM
jgi:hypothetical protein